MRELYNHHMNFKEREGQGGGEEINQAILDGMRIQAGKILGKVTPETVEIGLNISKESIPALLLDSQSIFDQAVQEDEINRELGAMNVTLSLIQELANTIVEITALNIRENPTWQALLNFTFHYDFTAGMKSLGGSLWGAQDTIAGTFEKDWGPIMDNLFQGVSPEKQAETILVISKDLRKFANLLRQDPTGFSAVDAAVGLFEEGKHPPFTVKEWVVAGAKGAREIYKQIYPQATALLKPQ